jgi:N-acetylglutamate synthase-like GNAT family acetyltransferase
LILQAIDDDFTPMGYLFLLFEEDTAKFMGVMRHPEYKGLGVIEELHKNAILICKEIGMKRIYAGVLKKREGCMKNLLNLGFKEIECSSKNHRRFIYEF